MDKQNVKAALLGVMLGDAMGFPVESMSQQEIKEKVGRVESFIDPVQWRIKDTVNLKAGDTTDDWQLTLAVANALLKSDGYDQMTMARHHGEALEKRTVGWGGTTDLGVKEMKLWFDTEGKEGRSPLCPVGNLGKGMGSGNGVAMKCAPLVMVHALQNDREGLLQNLNKMALMTHANPEPFWCALAFAFVLFHALQEGELPALSDVIEEIEERADASAESSLRQLWHLEDALKEGRDILNVIQPNFSAIESIPFALGMVYSHPPHEVLLACVNAGGDSDSTAAMAACIIGGAYGLDVFPKEWQNFRSHFAEALSIGDQLAAKYGNFPS